MKFFLGARWARRLELKGYRDQLIVLGHDVLSTWLDSTLTLNEVPLVPVTADGSDGGAGHPLGEGSDMSFGDIAAQKAGQSRVDILRTRVSEIIFTEITECDAFVAFSDPAGNLPGANYAEFGIAKGQGKRMFLIGERQHILHYHGVIVCKDWPEFLRLLAAGSAVDQLLGQEPRRNA